MAKKKKGKRDERKTKVRKGKKAVPKRKQPRVKSARPGRSRQKAGKRTVIKKSVASKKSSRRKAVPLKKASKAQKRITKPSKIPSRRGRTTLKNKAFKARIKTRKRPSQSFKLGKRVPASKRSVEWNYIARASRKTPKRAKYVRKVLTGSKDKSRGSEYFGKRFRIKKTIQAYKPMPVDEKAFKFLVKRNIRALKINGKTPRKAYLKAMYIDQTGTIRWTSVTREELKTKTDVADKVRLLLRNLKKYGEVKLLGIETEEVEREWDADEFEDMGDSEI